MVFESQVELCSKSLNKPYKNDTLKLQCTAEKTFASLTDLIVHYAGLLVSGTHGRLHLYGLPL